MKHYSNLQTRCGKPLILTIYSLFLLWFTPSKVEQLLWGMELQEKEAQTLLKHTGDFFRKNLLTV